MINRILFDTNIYGFMLKDEDETVMKEILVNHDNFKIIGSREVRRELKKTSDKELKNALLRLYESINADELKEGAKEEKLAKEYFSMAKELGKEKIKNWKEMKTDLVIIACASLNNIDIVFSEDKRTMLGKYCIEAYNIINLQKKIRTPTFYTYKQLKRSLINEISKKKD